MAESIYLLQGDAVLNALFYQYRVRPTEANKLNGRLAGAIATVILFAESYDIGRARSGRFIACNHWEIEKVMRVMVVCPKQIENFDAALKKVYRRAERFGIAAIFDSWTKSPRV